MDFIIGLLESTYRGVVYNFILVIMDRYTKIARYIPYNKIVDTKELVDIIIDKIIYPYSILKGIIIARSSIFTSSY